MSTHRRFVSGARIGQLHLLLLARVVKRNPPKAISQAIARLAQSVERKALNLVGSSPTVGDLGDALFLILRRRRATRVQPVG